MDRREEAKMDRAGVECGCGWEANGIRVRVTNGDGLACATGARRRRRRGPHKGKTGLRRTASDSGRETGRRTHMFIDKQRRRSKKEDGEGLREQGTQGEVMERRRYHRIQGRRSHRRRRWIDERRRRWTERVSSAAAVGRRMGLGLGCRVRLGLRTAVGRRGEWG